MAQHRSPCANARMWLSQHRDGEAGDSAHDRAHVETCGPCQEWAGAIDVVLRRARLHSSPAPDVVSAALESGARQDARRIPVAGLAERFDQAAVGRAILAVAGTAGLLFALTGLADAAGYIDKAGPHLGWELYSFDAVLAVALLLAARRPQRYAHALFPIVALFGVLTFVPAAQGMGAGSVDPMMEASHFVVLVGFIGLWLLHDALPRSRAAA